MSIAFVMDVAVLVLLAATVVLAYRLTRSLRTFSRSRAEMEQLIVRLTGNIKHAEEAVAGMQNAARTSGVELQKIINESKFLGDELKFMNESGNALAGRLEKLAERNRELVEKMENSPAATPSQIVYKEKKHEQVQLVASRFSSDDLSAFAIRDRDYDDLEEEEDLSLMEAADDLTPSLLSGLQSQAERELFEAIQNSKAKARKTTIGRA